MSESSTLSPPIDDLTYDVISVLQRKAKALEAYDKYIDDADEEGDDELKDLFTEMRRQDEEHILILKESLARRLDEDLGYEDDIDEDYDEVDVEEPSLDGGDEVSAATSSAPGSSRRGELPQRQR